MAAIDRAEVAPPPVPLPHGVPSDHEPAAVRVHDHQRAEGRGTAQRGRRDRPRLRQPGHPLARDRGREAGRGRPASAATTATRCRRACPSSARPSPRCTSATGASTLDPETEITNTIGSKEGFSHLMWVLLQPGDAAIVPSAELPDPHLRPAVRRRRSAPGPDAHRRRLLRGPGDGVERRLAQAPRARDLLPAQPHRRVRRPAVHAAGRRLLPRARDDRGARLRLRRRRLRRLPAAVDPAGRGGQGVRGRALLDDQELLDGRLAGGLPVRQPRGRGRRSSS